MDRTAWIVVTLCALGMGLCLYLMSTQERPQVPPTPTNPGQTTAVDGDNGAAGDDQGGAGEGQTDGEGEGAVPVEQVDPSAPEALNVVKTDNVEWIFSSYGGGIKKARLLPGLYVGDEAYEINESARGAIGALSTDAGDIENTVYELQSPEGQSPVVYSGVMANGVTVEKSYTLSRSEASSGYLWDLQVTLTNPSEASRKEAVYVYAGNTAAVHDSDLIRPSVGWHADGDTDSWNLGKFKSGGFMGFGRRGDDPADLRRSGVHAAWQWMGLFNQFYTSLISPRDVTNPVNGSYWVEYIEVTEDENGTPLPPKAFGRLHMGVGPGLITLDANGGSHSLDYELYVGPRSHNILEDVDQESKDQGRSANREDILFYGWFGMVSRFLMSSMTFLERYVGSWGMAIVVLTIFIRLLIWPLHAKSHRTMKRMALLSPKMQELKEKYPDNPQKMQQEVMKLYRDYGVSPVGGCLPIFLQFPIFLGYYRMLQSAVELRGQGFLWAPDLSIPDTVATIAGIDINPLPLVMALTMFIQMRMTPKSEDKNVQAQQRMFMFMPFIFLFICYNFASALALYWTVQNIFGIGQTMIMKRFPEPTLEKREPRQPITPPTPGQKPKRRSQSRAELAGELAMTKQAPSRV